MSEQNNQEQQNQQTQDEQKKEEKKGEQVSREAYEKLLAEKRNFAEKAKQVEAELEAIKTSQLKEKEDYKSMYEMALKKAQEASEQLKSIEAEKTKSIKLTKVKQEWEKLGLKDSKVAEKLFQMVNLDALKYDQDLKVVLGHEDEAKRIFEDFQPLFGKTAAKADHSAPNGIVANASLDSYKQMLKDGSFNKLTKDQQREYVSNLYQSHGMTVKK